VVDPDQGRTAAELGHIVGCTPETIVSILNRLEGQGLVDARGRITPQWIRTSRGDAVDQAAVAAAAPNPAQRAARAKVRGL
jgi:hypothetical protein